MIFISRWIFLKKCWQLDERQDIDSAIFSANVLTIEVKTNFLLSKPALQF